MPTEHGISIAPSTYYKAKARGRVSAAELADAYAPTPCTRCMWPIGGSTVSANSDTRSNALVMTSIAIG
ncbi:hypothetical protein [Rhodococcus pyridinivorans]|uniref:hypothetical protein n=1 Tax=Rhodococcus pyridinivorans TaxID=103816 RepID=UPI0022836A68|nr:hypothetical protein [Rhodococcus pyridinivorans]WAL49112.1 hypothetical protein OQN32_25775 [Rhodococcus pyridinivorans]